MSTRKQIEELITGYLSGNTNKEDTERLVAWIKESPDNLRYYQRLKNIWQVSHPAFGADTIQVASANEKMMSRITPVKWYESRFIRYWQYAAAILLLPLVVFLPICLFQSAYGILPSRLSRGLCSLWYPFPGEFTRRFLGMAECWKLFEISDCV